MGWKKLTGHIVFDVKMDLMRKARWEIDGYRTINPIGYTYAGLESRKT